MVRAHAGSPRSARRSTPLPALAEAIASSCRRVPHRCRDRRRPAARAADRGARRRARLPTSSNCLRPRRRASRRSRDVPASRWKAAAAITACGLAALLFARRRAPPGTSVRSARSPANGRRSTLADGSELQLGPNTLLQVDLGDARRSVELVRGEAYFKVAKDPARPFFVQANAFAVRAVGTEFAVSRRKREVIVTVAEGSVRVAPSAKSATGRRRGHSARAQRADRRRTNS